MTSSVTQDRYKGWLVEFGHPPVPCRGFDWVAIHPLYDYDRPNSDLLLEASTREGLIAAIDAWPADVDHLDNDAVDAFAVKMKAKMAVSRAKGREGWDDPARCSPDVLKRLLFAHAEKGDPVDVANFCMMLDHYGASTSLGEAEPVAWLHVMQMEHGQFQQRLMFCESHPWGTPGVHYDASYTIKSHPHYATLDVPALSPQTLPAPGEVERLREALTKAKQAARYVAVGDGYYDPYASHIEAVDAVVDAALSSSASPEKPLATVAAANDEAFARGVEAAAKVVDAMTDAEDDASAFLALDAARAAIRLLSQGGGK